VLASKSKLKKYLQRIDYIFFGFAFLKRDESVPYRKTPKTSQNR